MRRADFPGADDPHKPPKATFKGEVNRDAWETLNSDESRPFPKPESGRIAGKVVNRLGDEVRKAFREGVPGRRSGSERPSVTHAAGVHAARGDAPVPVNPRTTPNRSGTR